MHSKKHLRRASIDVSRRLFFENLETRLLYDANTPSVSTVTPAAGATGVALDVKIQATVNLPNGGVNPNTVTNSTVYLYPTAFPNNNSKEVFSSVKTTGGGDAIILSPLQNLQVNTSYTFVVTSGLADVNGDAFAPFSETFTTGNTVPKVSQNYAFTQVPLPTTAGFATTDVQMGPDGDLWASTEVGQILRFPINADGTLGTPDVITSLQTAYGGNRLISGFAFDPAYIANPSSTPKIWVSNTYYALSGATNAPNFTSALTVMSGANLGTVQNAIIDLPRSVADHVNDQPVFQPGTTNLFFCQAGENAYGAPDTTWGNRPETLLSAAILEVNTPALNLSTPLNVLTPDVGGTYNPYASGAPVTIYATGIRNAFDLMFDDKGQLSAPTNGSSAGGNTPAGGNAPALTNVQQVEEDTLVRVAKGAYYGHPDPARNQFVLDQGNPSKNAYPGLAFTEYPAGTAPDPNYHFPDYLFGLHSSPDGIIEYHGNEFNGRINGKFLVAEYSAPNDIAVLSVDSGDHIIGGLVSGAPGIGAEHGVSGLTHFNGPVSLVENQANGNIYVSELAGNKITLLEPSSITQQITPSRSSVAFNTIAAGNPGAASSRTETVTITNTGADQLILNSIGLINDPTASPAASDFTIVNASSEPASLNAVGSAFTFQIQFHASIVGIESAILQIKSNDPATPTLNINLHGIGTAGVYGSLEPSLVQVLRAHNIPTIVGAGPDDVNINTVAYPQTPDATSQEVSLQRMVAATPGPVTITALASFSTATQPVSSIGYYTPGNGSAITQLFTIAQADSQTVDPTPVGMTSFNPGSNPFSLYAYFPGVATPNNAQDYHYSEDALNTSLDPANPRKIRFFPYETPAGVVIPNTYVFAVEDYNGTTYNSFDNFVGIISNVAGGPAAPTNVTVTSSSTAGVVLNWTASTGATSYTVAREGPGESSFTPIATGLTAATYTDVNVTAGSTYLYEVQAVNSVDSSAFTASVMTTISSNTPPPPNAPAAPTNVQVTSATSAGVSVSWTASLGATSYTVLRLSPGASTFTQIATGLTGTAYTDANVTIGDSYQYQVIAQNSAGPSPASQQVMATIPDAGQTLAITVGKGASKAVEFFNDAGTLTTVKMTGFGTATVNFAAATISQASNRTGVVVSGTGITIVSITTTGTRGANSVLMVTTHGGPNTIALGGISADGSLNAINAPTASLGNTLAIAGSISRISLGSVSGGTISVGGVLGMLKVPSVAGLALSAGGPIKNINATTWNSTMPISAPSIGNIMIAGAAQIDIDSAVVRSVHVKGSLHDSTFLLRGAGIGDLPMLTAGIISNTIIDSAGNIGTISAAAMVNSQIFAGTGNSGATAFPPISVFPALAVITAVHLKKTPGGSFVNSSIAASRINSLALGTIQFSNGGVAFGVEANAVSSLSSFNLANGRPFTLTRLLSPAIVTADLAAKGISPQDFEIDIV